MPRPSLIQTKRSYSVWHDHQEQWDADNIDPAALTCQAISFAAAAKQLADDCNDYDNVFIVRDNDAGEYCRIELVRAWTVKSDVPLTIDELCAP